jgi:hypothetical protein
MKVTLDHNCIIDLAKGTATGRLIRAVVDNSKHQCFIVDIGASEARELGVKPDRYDLFEELLSQAGVQLLPRLSPLMVWDITFWDKALWADDKSESEVNAIGEILFAKSWTLSNGADSFDSLAGKKWLNKVCDVQTMWCHLHYNNDMFLTSDQNFMKATKLPKLIALGAGRICSPGEV